MPRQTQDKTLTAVARNLTQCFLADVFGRACASGASVCCLSVIVAKYGTPYLFTSANLKLTLPSDVILRRTTLFQPISPPSGPCNAP